MSQQQRVAECFYASLICSPSANPVLPSDVRRSSGEQLSGAGQLSLAEPRANMISESSYSTSSREIGNGKFCQSHSYKTVNLPISIRDDITTEESLLMEKSDKLIKDARLFETKSAATEKGGQNEGNIFLAGFTTWPSWMRVLFSILLGEA